MIEKDFLYESNIGNNDPIEKAKNTFYGFWQIMCNLDDKNHMPEDLGLKQRIFDQFIKNNGNFNLINMDLSNIIILYMNLYSDSLVKINLKNIYLFRGDIFCLKKQYININEAKSFSSLQIRNIYFEDITFTQKLIDNSIFTDCEFINVRFENSSLYENIFHKCIFRNCKEINFDMLKNADNDFINCTIDGKKFR